MATILIVDDEEPVRDFLAQLLSDAGHRTLQAIHGAHALEMVDREQPDLVISDIMMPVLNGADLCRRLKARAELPANCCDPDELGGRTVRRWRGCGCGH